MRGALDTEKPGGDRCRKQKYRHRLDGTRQRVRLQAPVQQAAARFNTVCFTPFTAAGEQRSDDERQANGGGGRAQVQIQRQRQVVSLAESVGITGPRQPQRRPRGNACGCTGYSG